MFKLVKQQDVILIEIDLDGDRVSVPEGISVAAALLYLGHTNIRSSVISNSSRGPFCMIGQCFECLVTINSKLNQRACQVIVKKDMHIVRQLEDVKLI